MRQEGLIKGGRRFNDGRGLRPGLRCCRRRGGAGGGAGGGEGGMGFTMISGSTGTAFSADGVSPPIATANPHQAVLPIQHAMMPTPGLPATPGQGNSHVSRETLLPESYPSA